MLYYNHKWLKATCEIPKYGGSQMNNKQFFFCYSSQLFKYLTEENSFDYITIAREPKNNKMFSLFFRTNKLNQKLIEYSAWKKG